MSNMPPLPPSYGSANNTNRVPGFPAYDNYTANTMDKETLDTVERLKKTKVVDGVKAGVGLVVALIAFVLPLGLGVLPMVFEKLADPVTGAVPEWSFYAWFGYLFFCVIVGAAAAVQCVRDIAHYHSRMSSFGLFLCFISPFVWTALLTLFTLLGFVSGVSYVPVEVTGEV